MLYLSCECEVILTFIVTMYVPQKTPSGVFCFGRLYVYLMAERNHAMLLLLLKVWMLLKVWILLWVVIPLSIPFLIVIGLGEGGFVRRRTAFLLLMPLTGFYIFAGWWLIK